MKINIKTSETDSFIRKSAIVQLVKWRFEVYFQFPLHVKNDLIDTADPFLYSLLFILMKEGGNVYVDIPTTESAARNIAIFSRLWSIWKPKLYKPIIICSEIVKDKLNPSDKIITAFSGGLDASYTAFKYKHKLDPLFQLNLDKALMIFGADIPLEDKDSFLLAYESAKKMTDDLGIELIAVETNIRKHIPVWSYAFGSVIAGCLSFFAKNYGYGAASDSSILNYRTPWGMNPITDQLFATPAFKFISDGWEHSRTDRAAIIKDWKTGIENLRVCWQNEDKSKNCGHCEKCIRTKLNFKVVGVDHMSSMPSDITISEFCNDNLVKSAEGILFYKEIYAYAMKHHTLDNAWSTALKDQIYRWECLIDHKKDQKFSIEILKKIISRFFKSLKQ